MPVHRVKTPAGPAMQWGTTGKKYAYDPANPESRERAIAKAEKQGIAIRATGWTEDTNVRND